MTWDDYMRLQATYGQRRDVHPDPDLLRCISCGRYTTITEIQRKFNRGLCSCGGEVFGA